MKLCPWGQLLMSREEEGKHSKLNWIACALGETHSNGFSELENACKQTL